MSSVKGQRQRILPPYTRQVDDFQHRALKTVGISAMVLLAMICGYMLALFGTFAWFIPAIVVVLLAAIALWMAPDSATDLRQPISKFLFLYLGILLFWPSYLAFNIPGLPWVSLLRMVMIPLAGLVLLNWATSREAREEVADRFRSHKLLTRLFLGWIVWQAIMQLVGGVSSPGRWSNNLTAYYLMMAIMAWLMTERERVMHVNRLIIAAAVVTSLITIWEFSLGYVPWAESIPSFFALDPTIVETLNKRSIRSGQYRAISIFMTAVAYGEFIGIVLPFVFLAMLRNRSAWRKTLAVAAFILLFFGAYFNNSRTAMVAFVVVPSAFITMWVWRRFQRSKRGNDLLAASMAYGLPAVLMMVAAAVLTVGRIRRRVLGGGEHAASNDGREQQWDMAIPVIIKNPVGHGMGTVSQYVPYTNRGGVFTIDSYPINLLVEVGVPGFLLFTGMFICAAVMGIKVYINAENEEEEVAGAAALGIISFLITRMILSSETGHSFVYPLMGLILAQWYMQKKRNPVETKVPAFAGRTHPPRESGMLARILPPRSPQP